MKGLFWSVFLSLGYVWESPGSLLKMHPPGSYFKNISSGDWASIYLSVFLTSALGDDNTKQSLRTTLVNQDFLTSDVYQNYLKSFVFDRYLLGLSPGNTNSECWLGLGPRHVLKMLPGDTDFHPGSRIPRVRHTPTKSRTAQGCWRWAIDDTCLQGAHCLDGETPRWVGVMGSAPGTGRSQRVHDEIKKILAGFIPFSFLWGRNWKKGSEKAVQR